MICDVREAVLVEVLAQLRDDVRPGHVGHVAEVVLRGDLVRQDGARAAREHVAAPDAVDVHRGAVAPHRGDGERIVGDEARDAEPLGRDIDLHLRGLQLELVFFFLRELLDVVVEAVDQHLVAGRVDERRRAS